MYGEYGKFKAVCDTQNLKRIRGKNVCVHGEDTKIHKTEAISVNNDPTWIFFCSFLSIKDALDYPKKPLHATFFLSNDILSIVRENIIRKKQMIIRKLK